MWQYLRHVRRQLMIGCGLLLVALEAGGCSPYQIEGLVVPGRMSEVLVLDADDQRLDGQGLEGVSVELTLEPKSMSPKPLKTVVTDGEGRFVVPVDKLGGGVLEYEVAVHCSIEGFQTAYQTLQLPWRGKRLLITMAVGRDTFQPKTDILRETQDMAEELLQK